VFRWQQILRRIENLTPELQACDDQALRKRSLSLKYQALSGQFLDDLISPAFAIVREAAHRTIGIRHYDVQLLGGIAMHFRGIAVMQTGEGKSLTATLPLYLNALLGRGVHLATANDYLADRDANTMRPLFEALGLTVGVVQSETSRTARQAAYQCDVTYSTAKELGFDFLRDRLLRRHNQQCTDDFLPALVDYGTAHNYRSPVQRPFNFLLVDEADSIMIDEARTPLVVSSSPDEVAQATIALYRWSAEVCGRFNEEHFDLMPKTKQTNLTAAGRRLVRKLPKPEILNRTPMLDIYENVEQAIFVHLNYVRDRHYVVRDGEVVIVDEYSGRLAEGRKWRAGLHQAIEAREGLNVTVATPEAARITIQDLCLKYDRLAGMTGTVGNSASELRKIYKLHVVDIPTHQPSRRKPWPDLVFPTESQKWESVVDEIEAIHVTGRPILIGTRSIDKSEKLSKLLAGRKIRHDVLNARHLAREAIIVADAGRVGRVTVATNMAGRGTDIKVEAAALELGGLHVICTELHESYRIDRQLIGRCGRQGDVGTFRQFMSLEDEILRVGLGEKPVTRLRQFGHLHVSKLSRFAPIFRKAQRLIERRHFEARKLLLYREKLRTQVQLEMGQDPYLDIAGA
jgi:preprotein translocase subunit SecA